MVMMLTIKISDFELEFARKIKNCLLTQRVGVLSNNTVTIQVTFMQLVGTVTWQEQDIISNI
jgi:hypothetical protein